MADLQANRLKLESLILEKSSAKSIVNFLEALSDKDFEALKTLLVNDNRKAITAAIKRREKKMLAELKERERMAMMVEFELKAYEEGYKVVAGIDEAGRGPLAGPVVAGVAVLNIEDDWTGLDDSKKLTETQRDYFFDKIIEDALAYGIGIADQNEIDEYNIINATKLAMKRAIEMAQNNAKIDFLLIDAVELDDIPIKQCSLIKGDARSISIAAASVVAKVTRDRIMDDYHDAYPLYGFKQHKGYGTAAHYDALNAYGTTEIHRESFIKKWRIQNNRWD